MEKYEPLGVVGEGSYGVVLKCKNKESGEHVAIKKFIDSEDDLNVRKIALREIRVLRKLRHENLVGLLEVFRRRKHLYLVFEFIDHTLLDELESNSHGLQDDMCRAYIFQILRGLGFCHDNGIIHRDVKPENVLVSKDGIVKLCDFGFARTIVGPGEQYTDYVATRWYRAPELLVGDVSYGKEVDIWAVGCLFAEMMSGEPLFPGDSDIDQLFLIAQCLGRLAKRHLSIMSRNSAFRGFQFNQSRQGSSAASNESLQRGQHHQSKFTKLDKAGRVVGTRGSGRSGRSVFSEMFPSWSDEAVQFITVCLDPEPSGRPGCNALLRLQYFTHDSFATRFLAELNEKLGTDRTHEPVRSPFSRKVKRSTAIIQSQGPQPTSSSSPRHPLNYQTNSNKGPYPQLGGGGLKKNPNLYQTRSNLAATLHESLSPKAKPEALQPSTNSMGIRREATFIVGRSSGGGGLETNNGSTGAPPPLTKSNNGGVSSSSTRIPSLFTRKFSSDTLIPKPRDIPASRSTPNIIGESNNGNNSNNVKKRLSMPQQSVEPLPVSQQQGPSRKLSYSFPSQNQTTTTISGGGGGPSHEGSNNSHGEGLTSIPVTTLTFTMNPLLQSSYNNFQSSNKYENKTQRSASPNKPYSTNGGGSSGGTSSSYFPHTQHHSGFHSIKSTTPYLVSSIYGGKMLPSHSSTNKAASISTTISEGTTNEGFLPKVGTLHNKSSVSVSTSGGSSKGDNMTTTRTMPSLINNSSTTISPSSFNLTNVLPGAATNSLGRRRDSVVGGGGQSKTHSNFNASNNDTLHSYQPRNFSTFSLSNNPNYINNNNNSNS